MKTVATMLWPEFSRPGLVEQVAAARVVPQVMVRVDDRQPGFEDLLA